MKNYIYKKMTFKEINKLLHNCYICILSIINGEEPYMVPMYYEYNNESNEPKFILESKNSGQKINCLKANHKVCLYIQYNDDGCFKTVVIGGKASLKKISNSASYPDLSRIIINVEEMSGRIYHKERRLID